MIDGSISNDTPAAATARRRVVVIDDDVDFAEALRDFLTPHGYGVSIINDVSRGLDAALLGPQQVILIAQGLRARPGLDVAEELLERDPRLVCVLMTTSADADSTHDAMQVGVYDFLRKPLNPQDIIVSLERCFSQLHLEHERHRAAAALENSNERFRNLVEGSIQGILVHRHGKALFANAALANMFGYDQPADILALEDVLSLISAADRQRVERDTARRLRGSEAPARSEVRGRARDGSTLFLELMSMVVDWDGEPATQEVLVDITKRHQALEDRSWLAAALEQAGDAVFITNTDGVIKYVNPAFERITGYSEAEALGSKPSLLKSGVQSDDYYRDVWQTLKAGENWSGRYVNRTRDGSLYTAESTHSPVRDEHGEIRWFISVQRDVSEQMLLEERLRRAQRMEAIGTMAGGIAHDFNNLLVPILGFANLTLAQLDPAGAAHENISRVLEAATRARELISQILLFSRRKESAKEPLTLGPIVKEVCKLLGSTLPKSISLVEKVEPDLPTVLCDATQMHQVLMNLCVNAGHAMPDGGTILISLDTVTLSREDVIMGEPPPGEYVRITVMDTGTGMDEATLARIFEPFFTTKEDAQGTGLGLSMVWGIVQQHGGGLNVVSSPEEGSTFEVYLPVISQAPAASGAKVEQAAGGCGRIMYVDDEELISLLGKQALEAQGYAVETFTDAARALAAFTANPGRYDLLITDQAMPGLAGSELIRRIRALRNELPVILCTGYSEILNNETARTLGIDEILAKPYDIDQLKFLVRQVLDNPA